MIQWKRDKDELVGTLPASIHYTLRASDRQRFASAKTVTLFIAADAQLTGCLSFGKLAVQKMQIVLAENAKTSLFGLLSEFEKVTIIVTCAGNGSEGSIRLVGLFCHETKATLASVQEHQGMHTMSDVNLRALIGGTAQLWYDGLVSICKQAVGTQAQLENKNMLLSSQARVTSVPNLEIQNHDVQCRHGSATEFIDGEQLFYLQTRGIGVGVATRLLLYTFVAEVVPELHCELKAWLDKFCDEL